MQAELAKNVLQEHDIPASVSGDESVGIFGHLAGGSKLFVMKEHVDQAMQALQALSTADAVHRAAPAESSDDVGLARYGHLFLRLMGLYLAVEGIAGTLGSMAYVLRYVSGQREAGYDPTPDPYWFGWFVSSVVLGRRWLVPPHRRSLVG